MTNYAYYFSWRLPAVIARWSASIVIPTSANGPLEFLTLPIDTRYRLVLSIKANTISVLSTKHNNNSTSSASLLHGPQLCLSGSFAGLLAQYCACWQEHWQKVLSFLVDVIGGQDYYVVQHGVGIVLASKHLVILLYDSTLFQAFFNRNQSLKPL